MVKKKWGVNDVTSQDGKRFIVTGSNTGTGFHIAKNLAIKGGEVILACRNESKAHQAMERIRKVRQDSKISFEKLDLASLKSVNEFCNSIQNKYEHIDVLVNKAGVMVPPKSETEDGFELQFGVNHLGHFALTGKLLPILENSQNPRIVCMSSIAHNMGKIDFEDINCKKSKYKKWARYSQSKLANLIFAIELDSRLKEGGFKSRAIASHPGYSATDLQRHTGSKFMNYIIAMSAEQGSLPALFASTEDEALTYPYWGPAGGQEIRGWTGKAKINRKAKDKNTAKRLWEISCELTGTDYLN